MNRFKLHHSTENQKGILYFVEGFVVFQKHVPLIFTSYMTQYMHTNPHLITKRGS